MVSKRKGKGSNQAFKGLIKKNFSKIKQEYHDIDYIDQLGEKEKAYLSKFMFEELGANLQDTKFNKSKKNKKRVFDANNSRNRDIWSIHKALGRISFYTSDTEALEWWQSQQQDVDELSILDKPEYEETEMQLYYNKKTDQIFGIKFLDNGEYEYHSKQHKRIICRKEYQSLITDENVMKVNEPTT